MSFCELGAFSSRVHQAPPILEYTEKIRDLGDKQKLAPPLLEYTEKIGDLGDKQGLACTPSS